MRCKVKDGGCRLQDAGSRTGSAGCRLRAGLQMCRCSGSVVEARLCTHSVWPAACAARPCMPCMSCMILHALCRVQSAALWVAGVGGRSGRSLVLVFEPCQQPSLGRPAAFALAPLVLRPTSPDGKTLTRADQADRVGLRQQTALKPFRAPGPLDTSL